jgi:PadR family transcriptional regulator AphA
MERRPTLSLSEWAVLGLLGESARHGYDLAAELRPSSPLGSVWRVERPAVYRALDRLVALGLAEPRREERGLAGPNRTVHGITRRGRSALRRWLAEPVAHRRDVRGALLLKLVLADRLDVDRAELVRAQREVFAGPAAAATQADAPSDRDPVAAWRRRAAEAVDRFLDDLSTGA